MTLKIDMLRSFVAVAQAGNLADAATRLGRTQSAVSMTLKQFEERLGEKLFAGERKNRLTPLGEDIFALAQQQLARYDETVQAIETSARAPRGLLRIASVPSVAGLAFPRAITALTARHPFLRIDLRDTDSAQVIDMLTRAEADLGVVSGQPSLNGIETEPLFRDAFGLFCAPDHPLARAEAPPDLNAVVQAGLIANNLSAGIDDDRLRAAHGGAMVTVRNTLSLINMVRTGHWVTILPRSVLHIAPDTLAFRPILGLDAHRTVSLLIRSRSRHRNYAAELRDILRGMSFDALPGVATRS